MHGSSTACYNGVKNDSLGFNLSYSGKNGQAYGNGLYFGLSDHITTSYNEEGKEGTCLIALVLTKEEGSSGAYSYQPFKATGTLDKKVQEAYAYFKLSTPVDGVCNCMVVHEGCLVLVLGKVVPV